MGKGPAPPRQPKRRNRSLQKPADVLDKSPRNIESSDSSSSSSSDTSEDQFCYQDLAEHCAKAEDVSIPPVVLGQ